MAEATERSSFPVVFFDGQREMGIGNLNINPTLEYKMFKLMLSQMIGISPNSISIYLVEREKNPNSPFVEDRLSIQITDKVNLGLICCQKLCCFLIVLNRSQKSRTRNERMIIGGVEFVNYLPENDFSLTEYPIRIRPYHQIPHYQQIITGPDVAHLNNMLHYTRVHRDNYCVSMANRNLNSYFVSGYYSIPNPNPVPSVSSISSTIDHSYRAHPTTTMVKSDNCKIFCQECGNHEKIKHGNTNVFHPCLNDEVALGFRTPFGPISRSPN